MLQLLITIPIACLVKTRRTALRWSFIVPILFTTLIALTIGGRYLEGALLMIIICPMVTVFIQFVKACIAKSKELAAQKAGGAQ